jgi:hypothetical protein
MSLAIFPYMGSRGTFPIDNITLYGPTMAMFPYNGTVTFRWGVAQSGITLPKDNYVLFALGKWGGVKIDNHIPILVICSALPTANVTYPTEELMQADLLNRTPTKYEEFNLTAADIAGVGAKRWLCFKKDNVLYWVPYRVRTADGVATIASRPCDIFYTEIDVVDIPKVLNESMDADETFDLCWAENGRHASNGYDAVFKLTPIGLQLQDMIVERIELNARVAGQRAIKKDEMLTRSQLEAGNFVTIGYRDEFGELAGYLGESTKGFNLVIETDDHRLTAGTNIVTSIVSSTDTRADAWGSAGFASGITKVLFSDEPDWVVDGAGTVIAIVHNGPADEWGANSVPIKFRYDNIAAGEVYYSARTLHTGLWASHNDLTTTTFIEPAGAYGTLGHIQFKDTSSVTWNITTGQLEGTTGYRPGIIVEALGAATYYWRVSDGIVADEVHNADTVVFQGINGTTVTHTPPGPYNIIEIDRPLTIQDDTTPVGGADTTVLNFDSQSSTITTQPVNFVVTDDGSGSRTVKGYVPEASSQPAVFKSHWYRNLDNRGLGDNIAFSEAAELYNGLRMAAYAVVGPGGPHTGGVSVDSYQKILSSSTVITEGSIIDGQSFPPFAGSPDSIPERSYGANETLYDQRSVTVTDTGVYDMNFLASGLTDRHPVCVANALGAGHHRVSCHLFILRSGLYYNSQRFGSFDFQQWYVPEEVLTRYNGAYANIAQYQDGRGIGNSVPWEVQGSGLVYLEAGDEIFFVFSHRAIGDTRRIWFVGFYTFDMHKVYDGAPSLAITAHGLHDYNFGQDGALLNWEFRYRPRNTWI